MWLSDKYCPLVGTLSTRRVVVAQLPAVHVQAAVPFAARRTAFASPQNTALRSQSSVRRCVCRPLAARVPFGHLTSVTRGRLTRATAGGVIVLGVVLGIAVPILSSCPADPLTAAPQYQRLLDPDADDGSCDRRDGTSGNARGPDALVAVQRAGDEDLWPFIVVRYRAAIRDLEHVVQAV